MRVLESVFVIGISVDTRVRIRGIHQHFEFVTEIESQRERYRDGLKELRLDLICTSRLYEHIACWFHFSFNA